MSKNTRVSAKVDLTTIEGIEAAKAAGKISPQTAAAKLLALAKRPAFTFAEDEQTKRGLKVKVNPPGTSSKGRHYGATVSVSTGGFGAGASIFLSPAQVRELIDLAADLEAAAVACEQRYGNKVGA